MPPQAQPSTPDEEAKQARQARYVDLIREKTLESILRAAAEQRHGRDELHITYFNGEIREFEFVPRTKYKL